MRNTLVAALAAGSMLLFGCGGGGGGSPAAAPVPPASAPVPVPGQVTVTCPDSSATQVADTPETIAAAKAACPTVTQTPNPLEGQTSVSPVALATDGLVFTFSGDLASGEVTVWQGAVETGTKIPGTTTWTGKRTAKFDFAVRAMYGTATFAVFSGIDSVGRVVTTTLSFATAAMSCANDLQWSGPATLGVLTGTLPDLKTCDAVIGIRALVGAYNQATAADTCVIEVGKSLSAACQIGVGSGQFVVASTTLPLVDGHVAKLLSNLATDGTGIIAVLDTITGKVVATKTLPAVTAIAGNDTGTVWMGSKVVGLTWNYSSAALGATCLVNC